MKMVRLPRIQEERKWPDADSMIRASLENNEFLIATIAKERARLRGDDVVHNFLICVECGHRKLAYHLRDHLEK